MAIIGKLLKFSDLIFLKSNRTIIAQTFPELSGMLILIDILRLPNVIRSLRLLLCKIGFQGSVQFNSVAQSCTLCDPMSHTRQASLFITSSRSSLKLMSIKSVMPSSHLILCRPFLFLSPIPPSIRVFLNESTLLMRWPKYWSFSFSISPSNEHPGLITFRMDCLDFLAIQGTLKSLLQHHSSKASGTE